MNDIFKKLIHSEPVTDLLDFILHVACTNLKLLFMLALTVAVARILRELEERKWLEGVELHYARLAALGILAADSVLLFMPQGLGSMVAALSKMVA